jgi:energy-coupling factor transporter transmembrane protein EcfT
MKNIVNKPRISKWVGGMYGIITVFIPILFIAITFGTDIRLSPLYSQFFFFGIMIFISFIMGLMTYSFYRTEYVIHDGVLYSWSPFAIIKLKLNDIKKVERTIVPFHIRVGASLYSGRFYIPSLGWTKSIITNLSDGVIITTKDNKRYLITPSNPDRFVKSLIVQPFVEPWHARGP